MNVLEPQAIHNMENGVIEGKHVIKYEKTLGEVEGLYQSKSDLPRDTLVYTVYSYEEGERDLKGNLYWGLTILEPLTVNGECNMTRGHFHKDRDCAEFYFGISGEGLLLLMDEDGSEWAERVFPGSLHHIDGRKAHRLINTGTVRLKVGACWPSAAGHDYEAIEAHNFSQRVFRDDGKQPVKG